MTVILVTGAASGIGAAIAQTLAAPGTRLVLHTGRNAEGLARVADHARAAGAEVATCLGGLEDPAVPAQLIATARDQFGALDQIVSNAGRAQTSSLADLTDADLLNAFATMPLAFFRLVQAARPLLEASACGRVVAISSFVAHLHGANGLLFPATSAAKAALEALAKSLAWELGPTGITVNSVAPGFTRKDATGHAATTSAVMESAAAITPSRRIGTPADIAGAVAFLLSDAAAHVTGQTLHVDGGLMLP